MRSRVVLPAPFGPRRPNTPAPARRSTPATAVADPNRRMRPVISTLSMPRYVARLRPCPVVIPTEPSSGCYQRGWSRGEVIPGYDHRGGMGWRLRPPNLGACSGNPGSRPRWRRGLVQVVAGPAPAPALAWSWRSRPARDRADRGHARNVLHQRHPRAPGRLRRARRRRQSVAGAAGGSGGAAAAAGRQGPDAGLAARLARPAAQPAGGRRLVGWLALGSRAGARAARGVLPGGGPAAAGGAVVDVGADPASPGASGSLSASRT